MPVRGMHRLLTPSGQRVSNPAGPAVPDGPGPGCAVIDQVPRGAGAPSSVEPGLGSSARGPAVPRHAVQAAQAAVGWRPNKPAGPGGSPRRPPRAPSTASKQHAEHQVAHAHAAVRPPPVVVHHERSCEVCVQRVQHHMCLLIFTPDSAGMHSRVASHVLLGQP